MATNITDWSAIPNSNDSNPPAGAPEGTTLISDLNDIAREMMAGTRQWFEDPDYRDLGFAITSSTSSTIVLTGDVQSYFSAGQSIAWIDAGATPVAGIITAIQLATGNTELTVSNAVTGSVTQVLSGPDFSSYDTNFASRINNGTDGNLVSLDSNGDMQDAGAVISTSVGADDSTVPTGLAVQTYVGQNATYLGPRIYTARQTTSTGSGNLVFYTNGSFVQFAYSWNGADCTITHNFGTNNYGVSVTPHLNGFLKWAIQTSNTIVVQSTNASGFYINLFLPQ